MLKRFFTNKQVAISGNIATGKTTLVKLLTRQMNASPLYEKYNKNPYLNNFYKNKKKWSFHSQLFFLINKFHSYKKLNNKQNIIIFDRTIYEDAEIFAKLLYNEHKITKYDFNTYWLLYKTICITVKSPNLMIYLKCPVPILKKRIFFRNRTIEKSITLSYLYKLEYLYDSWIKKYNKSKIIIIKTNHLKKIDYKLTINRIKKIIT
jgi:deoxyadenosine/deoxycytidine kinase